VVDKAEKKGEKNYNETQPKRSRTKEKGPREKRTSPDKKKKGEKKRSIESGESNSFIEQIVPMYGGGEGEGVEAGFWRPEERQKAGLGYSVGARDLLKKRAPKGG